MKHALSVGIAALALAGCADETPSKTVAQAVCPPPTLFDYGLCVCEDLAHVGELHVKPGPAGVGAIGVNGKTNLVALATSAGAWHAWGGFNAVGVSIGDSLVTPSSATFVGDVTISGDAMIGGDLSCTGELAIEGTLGLGGDERVIGLSTIATRGSYQAPSGPPCPCDPSTFFDVEGAVAAAATATGGQSSWSALGDNEIHLAGGNYYVTAADVIGRTRIYVDAPSSVFVDGSLRSVGATQWKIATGATLDLFVSGDVASVGLLSAGNAADPAAFRLYVGGAGTVGVGAIGLSEFYGSLYAPRAAVSYIGDARVVGSIFAKTILGVGRLTIEYGDGDQQPTTCDPDPATGSGSGESGPVFL